MGHRVAVLKDGELQQCDAPGTLYHDPRNLFVAGFIGSPAMNLIPLEAGSQGLRFGGALVHVGDHAGAAAATAATVGFRPEAVKLGSGPVSGRVRVVEDLGSEVFVHLLIGHQGHDVAVVAKVPAPFSASLGDVLSLDVAGRGHLFDPAGPRIQSGELRLG